MTKKPLKLYLWTGYAPDYSDGLAFALASSEGEARELVIKAYGGETSDWGLLTVHSVKRKIAACVSGGS